MVQYLLSARLTGLGGHPKRDPLWATSGTCREYLNRTLEPLRPGSGGYHGFRGPETGPNLVQKVSKMDHLGVPLGGPKSGISAFRYIYRIGDLAHTVY